MTNCFCIIYSHMGVSEFKCLQSLHVFENWVQVLLAGIIQH